MSRCMECGYVNLTDAPFCVSCRVRLGQEREHSVLCRQCRHGKAWSRSGLCEVCDEHEDAIGHLLELMEQS